MLRYLKVKYLNSSLRRKIIILIALFVTLVPTTLIATLAVGYYTVGIQALFNEKMSKSISQTVEVAERYLKEHKDNVRADILAIAKDVDKNYNVLMEDPSLFTPFLDKQAELRNLSEIVIFQRDRVIAKNSFSFSFAFERLPEAELNQADKGDVVILHTASQDKVRAILKLNNFVQTYILVGTYVDQSILDYLESTQGSAKNYNAIISEVKSTQMKLKVIFIVAFVVLLFISFILGKKLAEFITRPLNDLAAATRKLRDGDFSIKLPEKQGKDETAVLTRAFNEMTERLSKQRSELIKVNKIIDERRRFIEKVLAEVSAGVITVDKKHSILVINQSAISLLHAKSSKKKMSISDIFPEIEHLISKAKESPSELTNENIKIARNDVTYHLFVRIGVLLGDDNEIETIVVTFDDITELVSAQRTSAWADVARRVAHEIKNPLTPINLAAERLKSKYMKEIKTDPSNFEKYVDTITRHVQDIGLIVEEFVEFARIPTPKLKKNDINKIISELMFSQKVTYKNIEYELKSDVGDKCYVLCDSVQMSQVLLNILKNASESIEMKKQDDEKLHGLVSIGITHKNSDQIEIKITDNGVGIEKEVVEKIFEPYVTTKAKGTGLGLAIVKKIIEDHGGVINIKPLDNGAEVRFTLQIYGSNK